MRKMGKGVSIFISPPISVSPFLHILRSLASRENPSFLDAGPERLVDSLGIPLGVNDEEPIGLAPRHPKITAPYPLVELESL
ncbi:MAG: hypothetical protein ACRD21_10955, partial [Vicinamibacteria bacterium]